VSLFTHVCYATAPHVHVFDVSTIASLAAFYLYGTVVLRIDHCKLAVTVVVC
jgi:hypothetical protein